MAFDMNDNEVVKWDYEGADVVSMQCSKDRRRQIQIKHHFDRPHHPRGFDSLPPRCIQYGTEL